MTAMKPLVIFGAGDIARLADFYFSRDAGREVAAFTVDRDFRDQPEFRGRPFVDFDDLEARYPPSAYDLFVALSYRGMNALRARKCEEGRRRGYALATYVSSRCSMLTEEPPGDNCFILEDNTVQPFVTIGNNVTLWSGNHIGHDSVIEDNCFVSSHVVISGHVRVGAFCFIGVNATLRNSITLAPRTLVGAGAILMKDTAEGDVFVAERTPVFKKKSHQIDL
jgi:sugar O-acyltransferase (sialic acid O-acetyltransferase NeuD family)